MDHSLEALIGLVGAHGNTLELLELAEEVLDQMVASTMAYSMSGSSEAASKSRLKMSAFTQSRYRLKTVFQRPKNAGRSRQGLPVRAIHNTASTNRRLSAPLRPGSDCFPRQCGSILAHWASVSTNRSIASLKHGILIEKSQISTDPSKTFRPRSGPAARTCL